MNKKSTITSDILILIFKKRLSCIRFISSVNFILQDSNHLSEMEKEFYDAAINVSKNYGIKPSFIKEINDINSKISQRIENHVHKKLSNEETDAVEALHAEINLFIEKILSEEQKAAYLKLDPCINNKLAINFLVKIAQGCMRAFDKIIIQILSNDLEQNDGIKVFIEQLFHEFCLNEDCNY